MNIKANFREMIKDRAFWAGWVAVALILTIIVVIGTIYIRPTELQVPLRYSGFGQAHFYREKWYYELLFIAFAAVVAVFHTLISARLFEVKGRQFALAFLWLTVVVLTITAVFILAILRISTLSR